MGMMKTTFIAAMAFYILPITASLAFSSKDFPEGKTFSSTMNFNGYKIALPIGEWEVVGVNERYGKHTDGRAYIYDPGTIVKVILQKVSTTETDMIVLQSNVRSSSSGWAMDPICTRKDLPFVEVQMDLHNAKSCIVQAYWNWIFNEHTDQSTLQAKSSTEKKGKNFPRRQFFIQSYLTDKSYFLNIGYFFDERGRSVSSLKNWSVSAHKINETTFKQSGSSTPLSMPW